MRLKRGFRWTLFAALIGIVVTGVFIYFKRDALLETWHLFRLERAEAKEKPAILDTLARVGGRRTAAKCIELLEDAALDEAVGPTLADPTTAW